MTYEHSSRQAQCNNKLKQSQKLRAPREQNKQLSKNKEMMPIQRASKVCLQGYVAISEATSNIIEQCTQRKRLRLKGCN